MPVNECIPWFETADRIPAQAGVGQTILGKRFVRPTAARLSGPLIPATPSVGASDPTDGGRIQVGQCVAGELALGVSSWDAATGEGLVVITEGVVPVTTGAVNLAAGVAVQSDANGAAVILAAGVRLGTTVDASLAGADAQIKLIV